MKYVAAITIGLILSMAYVYGDGTKTPAAYKATKLSPYDVAISCKSEAMPQARKYGNVLIVACEPVDIDALPSQYRNAQKQLERDTD